jgi:phosphoglycolate phosphatase
MPDYKLIVFDWDGTLMDSEARIVACMRAALSDLGLDHRDDTQLKNVIGLGLREALSTLYPHGSDAVYEDLISRYRHHFLEVNDTPSQLFDGAAQLLHQLHTRDHRLAIATGKGRVGLDQALQQTGVTGYFHSTRCADETVSKPDPRMLHEIMDETGIDAAQTLMVGDTEYDMLMARNAGVDALAVSYGVHERQRLLDCEPLACLDSMASLQRWLLSSLPSLREVS